MDVTPVPLPTPKLGLLSKIVPDPVRIVLNWGRRYSLWVFNFGLACCAIEFIATSMARHDFIRLGVIPFAPGPRQADLMVVSGTVTDKMAPAVKRLYEQMPEPKYVISFGACSNCGGPYWDSYCVTKGVDQIIPVDVYVPGCPPRPEALLQGIVKLQEKIAKESLATRYGNKGPGPDALRRPWQAPPPAPISPWLPANPATTPADDEAKDEAETEELLAVLGFEDDAKTEQLPAQQPPPTPTRDAGPPVPPWGPDPPRAGDTRPLPKIGSRPPRGQNIGQLRPPAPTRPFPAVGAESAGPGDAGAPESGATEPLPAVGAEPTEAAGATEPADEIEAAEDSDATRTAAPEASDADGDSERAASASASEPQPPGEAGSAGTGADDDTRPLPPVQGGEEA